MRLWHWHAASAQVVPVVVRAERILPAVPLIRRECKEPFSAEVAMLASACLRVLPATMPNGVSSKPPIPSAVCDTACRKVLSTLRMAPRWPSL